MQSFLMTCHYRLHDLLDQVSGNMAWLFYFYFRAKCFIRFSKPSCELQASEVVILFYFFLSRITGRHLTCCRPRGFICVWQELLKGFSTHGGDAGEREGPCAFFQTLLPVQPTDTHLWRSESSLQACWCWWWHAYEISKQLYKRLRKNLNCNLFP